VIRAWALPVADCTLRSVKKFAFLVAVRAYFYHMTAKAFFKTARKQGEKILPRLKNKYVLTLLLFFGWMLFFDHNDIITRIKLRMQLSKLKKEKEFFQNEMKKIEETNRQLFSSDETLEKFAREKYLMKRDDEEIFLIVEKK